MRFPLILIHMNPLLGNIKPICILINKTYQLTRRRLNYERHKKRKDHRINIKLMGSVQINQINYLKLFLRVPIIFNNLMVRYKLELNTKSEYIRIRITILIDPDSNYWYNPFNRIYSYQS